MTALFLAVLLPPVNRRLSQWRLRATLPALPPVSGLVQHLQLVVGPLPGCETCQIHSYAVHPVATCLPLTWSIPGRGVPNPLDNQFPKMELPPINLFSGWVVPSLNQGCFHREVLLWFSIQIDVGGFKIVFWNTLIITSFIFAHFAAIFSKPGLSMTFWERRCQYTIPCCMA